MKVIRAREMGMCFGVEEALEIVRRQPVPSRVTIHGELVHNEVVHHELAGRGFPMSSEQLRRPVPPTEEVLITAHGISDRERARLQAAGKVLVDTTCPLVKHVHRSAVALEREGFFVVVVGKRGHVEVEGIVGDLERYVVVESPDEVLDWKEPRIGVVCQSTTSPASGERIRRVLGEKNPQSEIRWVDTICAPTRDRQQAADELLAEVEAVVVVGGSRSNNTLALVRLAESRGVPVLHIQTASGLDPDWLAQFEVVGLSAGTSTLSETIDEVFAAMLAAAGRREAATRPSRKKLPLILSPLPSV